MKVTAYKCPHCGRLFETRGRMETCRKKCKEEINLRQKKEEERQKAQEIANKIRLELTDINDLPNAISNVVAKLFNRSLEIYSWNHSFSNRLRPTHDAPIGKPTEFTVPQGVERNYYAGWYGRVEGRSDLYYSVPINDGLYGSISGLHDLSKVIKGVHFGSGGAGHDGKFGYEMKCYLDDFPKLKKQYEEYVELEKSNAAHISYASDLQKKAVIELIDSDERLITLNDIAYILDKQLKVTGKRAMERKEEIMNSSQWAKATTVPDELDYDVFRFCELRRIIMGR